MARDIDSAVQTEIDNYTDNGQPLRAALGFWADFDGDPLRVWTGVGDLTYNSNTYNGVGAMGSVAQVIEDAKLGEVKLDVSLSSIPQASLPDIVDAVTTGNPNGRDFELDLIFLDEDAQYVGVLPLTSGYIDGATIGEVVDEAGEVFGAVNLTLATESSRLGHRTFVRMTNSAQQDLFSGDKGLEFVTDTELKEIKWGQSASVATPRQPVPPPRPDYKGGNGFL